MSNVLQDSIQETESENIKVETFQIIPDFWQSTLHLWEVTLVPCGVWLNIAISFDMPQAVEMTI
jgi:hypothetical protein